MLFCSRPKAEFVTGCWKTVSGTYRSMCYSTVYACFITSHAKCFRMRKRFIWNNLVELANGLYFFCVIELYMKLEKIIIAFYWEVVHSIILQRWTVFRDCILLLSVNIFQCWIEIQVFSVRPSSHRYLRTVKMPKGRSNF